MLYLCNVIIKILNVMSRKNVSVVLFDFRLKKKLLKSGDVVYSVFWSDHSGKKHSIDFSCYSDFVRFLCESNCIYN